MTKIRDDLLEIYHAALAAVNGYAAVKNELESDIYPDSFHIIAIGKAADSMVQGVASARIKSALVISKHDHISEVLKTDSRMICIESDHPVPRENTIKAGQELLRYLGELPEKEPILFLISGGASSLVEVLDDYWDLSQLQELTDYLLANAYPINEINAIRRRISKIKGGGLWQFIGERPVYALLISDVPDDDPAVIGSGILFPVEVVELDTLSKLPNKFASKINSPKSYKQADDFRWKIIASLAHAKQAAASKANELGYKTKVITAFLEGEATQVAKICVDEIKNQPNMVIIWGGETTVYLPENPGAGGRNQHLALAAAIEIKGLKNCCLLSAGTDGSDGLSDATGAIVDGSTIQGGLDKQLVANEFLQNADSNSYFKETGEAIITGATGTNVMDLVIALYDPV